MNKTKIEWVKNPDGSQGYTWNPITGCLNHYAIDYKDRYTNINMGQSSGLCKGGGFPCYAYRLAHGRLKPLYLANDNVALPESAVRTVGIGYLTDPFYPRFWEERVGEVAAYSANYPKAKGIFVCDMSDLFGIGIPEEWTMVVLEQIDLCSLHRFYLLTKQPQNLIKFSPFPDNCWVGVTATSFTMLFDALWELQDIQAKVKYLSLEPLLDWTHSEKEPDDHIGYIADWFRRASINWLIIGACTGTVKEMSRLFDRHLKLTPMPYGKIWTAQPRIEYLKEIVEAADKAGIKVFLKDNLQPLFAGKEMLPWWALDSQRREVYRQEMPVQRIAQLGYIEQ